MRTQLDTEGESSYPLLCPTAVPLAKTHRVTERGRSGQMIVSLFMDGQLMNTHKLKKKKKTTGVRRESARLNKGGEGSGTPTRAPAASE